MLILQYQLQSALRHQQFITKTQKDVNYGDVCTLPFIKIAFKSFLFSHLIA